MTQKQEAGMDWLFGGEEMGQFIRAMDWSKTPLGAIASWSQSLRTTISILLNAPYPMFLFWGPQQITIYNDRYRSLMGSTHPADASGKPGAEACPEIWRTIGSMVDQVTNQGETLQSDDLCLLRHRNGQVEAAYFVISCSPVRDDDGSVGGVLCCCTETTQQALSDRPRYTLHDLAAQTGEPKSAIEQALQERDRLFATLAAVSPVVIFRFDTASNCIYVNARWSEMTGRPADTALGMGWVQSLHPEDCDRLTRAWLQWCQDSQQRGLYQNEGRCLRSDGDVVWFYIQALPEVDLEGAIAGYVGTLTDITALKQAEAALQESQFQLQKQLAEIEAIYQTAPIGLSVLDTELRFVRINERLAEMNGLSVEGHIGRTVREVVPELADIAEQLLYPILETGEPLLNVEISGETPARPGVQRTWLEHFLPLKNGDRIIGISTVCEEITERKRIEAARQQTEEELRRAKEELELRVAERTAELSQINADLRHSESILRSFFNSGAMLMGIVEIHDDEIVHISDNQASAQFLGTTPDAMQNRTDAELGIPHAITQQWLAGYRQAEQTQAPVRFDYLHTTPTGDRWFSVSLCQIAFSSSGYSRFSYIAKNITDRKQAEAILARREEQLRFTLDFTHIGTWDWNVQTGELVWNDNHFRLLGLEPETSTAALYQRWRDAIHAEDVVRVEQALHDALIQHTEYETEYRVCYPDGTIHWLNGRGQGIYSEANEPIRMLGVIIDISDRKQAEQTLELQAVITRNMAEGICLVRADNGIIVYANPKFEQMFGYDSGELNGQHISIVNYASETMTAEEVNQAIRSAVLQKGEETYEVHNIKKDGTPFWCSATTSVLDHPEYGRVLVAVQQDISDRKQAQHHLEASLKEKEVLLKEIHHRVKNNLGIVSSLLTMQARRTQDIQSKTILLDSQNRIASIALVHEKLYSSKDFANIDFTQYIRELTVYLFDSYNINLGQIKLTIQVDPVHLDIGTAIPCGLIINELVSNALKYAFPGDRSGEVQVLFRQSEPLQDTAHSPTFTLTVRDDGIGLPHDFNPKQSKTLGMTLVQGLVQQLEGTFEINNQHGTEFRFTFTKGIE
jgi:PAS domain S-box-containing protein